MFSNKVSIPCRTNYTDQSSHYGYLIQVHEWVRIGLVDLDHV